MVLQILDGTYIHIVRGRFMPVPSFAEARDMLTKAKSTRWYLHIGRYSDGGAETDQATIADRENPACSIGSNDTIGPCIGVFDSADAVLDAAHAHLEMVGASR